MAINEQDKEKLEREIRESRENRKWLRWSGIVIIALMVTMLIVDCTSSFPTPNRGEFVGLWIPAILFGVFLLFRSRKLPLEAALKAAELHGGKLTVHELVNELGITIDEAEDTLKRLCEKGQATLDYTTVLGKAIYDFELIRKRTDPAEKSQAEQLDEIAEKMQQEQQQARKMNIQDVVHGRNRDQHKLTE